MCEALSLDLYREDNYSVMCLFQGVEDPLLELKTPTLFIIGSHSTLTSQEEVEVCFTFFFPVWLNRNNSDNWKTYLHFMVYKISLLDIGWKGVHVDLAFAPIDQQSCNPH